MKNVCFFVDEKGDNPVRQFIETLPDKEQAKIAAYVSELRIQGHNLRRPLADYLGDGIYELRPKSNRVFYFFFLKDNAVLVHAIKKKTNKIPKEDLALCLRRKGQVVSLRSLSEWS